MRIYLRFVSSIVLLLCALRLKTEFFTSMDNHYVSAHFAIQPCFFFFGGGSRFGNGTQARVPIKLKTPQI